MLTITNIATRQRQRGSAALETLMLFVFLIVPIWMLLFTMGYAGIRLQAAQVTTRLAGHEVMKKKTKGENVQGDAQSLANQVGSQVFPAEENAVSLNVTNISVTSEISSGNDDLISFMGGLISGLSGNSRLEVSVSRKAPYGLFEASDITVPLTIGGTAYTYCEMKNTDFDPFAGEGISIGILDKLTSGSNILLAPFGGLPTGSNKC